MRIEPIFNSETDINVEDFSTDKEFKVLVKKYHPDGNDPFFNKLNTRKTQKLIAKRTNNG
jgi:hypothetical protein